VRRRAVLGDLPQQTVRRLLFSFAAVLLATAVAAGSGANFNAVSANRANVIRAGIVSFTTSATGSAALTVTALAPGHSETDSVDVVNSGDLTATFKLTTSSLVDAPASPPLSAKLDLLVKDLGDPTCSSSCPAAETLYAGKLGALDAVRLGDWAPGSKHRIAFTVSMPDGGSGAENAYQGARSTVDFTWNAAG
jgi:spore coat-associated protein N